MLSYPTLPWGMGDLKLLKMPYSLYIHVEVLVGLGSLVQFSPIDSRAVWFILTIAGAI